MRRGVLLAVLGLALCPGAASPVAAEPAGAPSEESGFAARFERGRHSVAALVGYGHGVSVFGGDSDEVDETRIAAVFLRYGVGLTGALGRGRFWEGSLNAELEPFALWNYEPRAGWAAGASLLLRYNFLAFDGIVPFAEFGGGVAKVEFDLEGQRDGMNFSPRAAIGFHVPITRRSAITTSLGFLHLSNGDRHDPNLGVNDGVLEIGWTALLD